MFNWIIYSKRLAFADKKWYNILALNYFQKAGFHYGNTDLSCTTV